MTESDTNMAVHEQKRLNLKAGLCMSCDQCNVHFLACKFDAKKRFRSYISFVGYFISA